MNKTQEKIIRTYISETAKLFPAFYPNKKKIVSDLKESLHSFCMEHQEFTTEELYNLFGTPQEYVASIIDNTDSDELRHNIRMKRRTFVIIGAISVFVIVVIILAVVEIREFTSHLATDHYEIIIEESTPIPDDN